jgi:acyl-CoA thioesterase-1
MNYRLFILSFCLLVLPFSLQAKTILMLGDSISAAYGIPVEKGWVSLLEQRLLGQSLEHKVVNASITGETTLGGRMRLADLLDKYQPDITVIELGGNDGLRGFSLEEIENNFISMVSMAKQANSDVLLVPMKMPPNYGSRYKQSFDLIYQKVSESADVSISEFILKNIADVPDLMQADGIHPVESAQVMMLDNVWPALSELINIE